MTKAADDVFDRVVDVHSTKTSKSELEERFRKCGPVNNLFHWKGNHDKPHMLVEYASLDSAKAARALSNDKSGLQVIRAYNNDGLIRKFRDLCRSHNQSNRTPKGPAARIRNRSRSRSPVANSNATQRRARSREPIGSRRPLSLSPRRESLSPLKKNSRPSWYNLKSSPVKKSTAPATAPQPSTASSDNNDWSRLKDLKLLTATPMAHHDNESPKQFNIPTATSASVLRIPFAGEIIQMDLSHQLEENPIGIITILTATEAAQQVWMIVAAHYNSLNNRTSARKVLEAGIELSIRLGRTDTRPFWYLLDQINSPHSNSSCMPGLVRLVEPRTLADSVDGPFNSVPLASLPSTTNLHNATDSNRDTTWKPGEKDECSSKPSALPSRPCESQKNSTTTTCSSTKEEISCQKQNLIDKLHAENKSLRFKYRDLLEDFSDIKASKRRADDDVKEERAVRRRLERDLKQAEDALKRSKRMEQTALDQLRAEVEFRRKAELLLGTIKAPPQRLGPRVELQQNILLQLISLIQNASSSSQTTEHSSSSGQVRSSDPRASQVPTAPSQELRTAAQ